MPKRFALPMLDAAGFVSLLVVAALVAGCSTALQGTAACGSDGHCGHDWKPGDMSCNEGFVAGGKWALVPVENVRCPIMGGEIDRAQVAEFLTSDFHGLKVGFCCASCFYTWQKLPEAQRESKLTKEIMGDLQPRPAPRGAATHSGQLALAPAPALF